ncbi:MAG: class I SAM-dependent methyltransferase [Bacteroidota bacterium]
MPTSILESWAANAEQWMQLIQQELIQSRAVTNPAIVDWVGSFPPMHICDMGCGEGWLSRALIEKGHQLTGIDGTLALVEHARQFEGHYAQLSYEAIAAGASIPNAPFDAMVFNFSLYEDHLTEQLLRQLANSLTGPRFIFIQTIHPSYHQKAGIDKADHWFPNAWAGLPGSFSHPHPWYFRTMESWQQLFESTDYQLIDYKEPKKAEQDAPASIIFRITPKNGLR